MFIAFDRVTVALALLGFYTYPAMVAVANVALGRERLDRPRAVALLPGHRRDGRRRRVPARAGRRDPVRRGRRSALAFGAAVSQTVYVVISRHGYRQVPTEQAMTVVLGVTVVGAGRRWP